METGEYGDKELLRKETIETRKYGDREIWKASANSEPIVPLIITGVTPKQVSRKYGDWKI